MRARDNPFSTDRVLAVRYAPQEMTWDDLWSRARSMSFRGAIVGPEGSGKTTLLEDLAPRLRREGFDTLNLRLDREQPAFSREQSRMLTEQDLSRSVVLFDGAEQLEHRMWRRFSARMASAARGLIITSHRPGLLPTLIDCATSPALLCRIVQQLTTGPMTPGRDEIETLWRCYNGNIRDALRELYDRAADEQR